MTTPNVESALDCPPLSQIPEPGFRSGRLVVVAHIDDRHKDGHRLVLCACDCGAFIQVPTSYIKSGKRRSCGCGKQMPKTHGHTVDGKCSRTYLAWQNMRSRCRGRSKTRNDFLYYTDRGITICDRWQVFEAFLEDMGVCPSGLTLDRIDNDGNYEPGNCRWTDTKTQQRNKRNNHLVTWQGEIMTIADLADRSGVGAKCLWIRLVRLGWSIDRATTTPVGAAHNTKK